MYTHWISQLKKILDMFTEVAVEYGKRLPYSTIITTKVTVGVEYGKKLQLGYNVYRLKKMPIMCTIYTHKILDNKIVF